MLQIKGLTKKYGTITALDNLDLEIAEGESFGLIGPNGAGKTTTLRILATILRPTSGEVTVCGHSLFKDPSAVRKVVGYMPDDAGLYEDMRVDEYLYFFASACGIRGAKATSTVGLSLELTGLDSRRGLMLDELSRGMRQRLGIARVLLHDPKVLLLDEPASGLDPHARVEMRSLVKELCAMRKTVIISSHILWELGELCTSLGILNHGKLLFFGSPSDLRTQATRGTVVTIRVAKPGTGEAVSDMSADESTATGFVGDANEAALEILQANPAVAAAAIVGGEVHARLSEDASGAAFIPNLLVERGFELHHFAEQEISLEDAFLRFTDAHATTGVISAGDEQ